MSGFATSWEEYRLLVIKELEELNKRADVLNTSLHSLITEVALVKQNSDKIDNIVARLSDTERQLNALHECINTAEEKLRAHENLHVTQTNEKKETATRLKDRHWSLFLALIAVVAAIVTAFIK